jgi:hypothetical protein
MVPNRIGLGTKNHSAGEGQQQFISQGKENNMKNIEYSGKLKDREVSVKES